MPPPDKSTSKKLPATASKSAASLEAALFHDPNAAVVRRYNQLVNTASAFDNAWYRRTFPAFHRYTKARDGRSVDALLSYCAADQLTAEQSEAVFQLTKHNMQTLYDECSSEGWKWNDSSQHHPRIQPATRLGTARAVG